LIPVLLPYESAGVNVVSMRSPARAGEVVPDVKARLASKPVYHLRESIEALKTCGL
jgi:hypothetical protein